MRSRLIFEVSERFSNRYQLCRMVAMSARKMHRDGSSAAQSINRSLSALNDAAKLQDAAQAAIVKPVGSVEVATPDEREDAAAVPAR